MGCAGSKEKEEEVCPVAEEPKANGSKSIWNAARPKPELSDLPMVEAELTDVELTELKDIFAMFDKDNSGSIDIKELDAMVSSLGIAATPEDLNDMIQEADLDGSGTIEFSEFKLLIGPHFQKEKPPEDYVEAFKFFDKDGDGFISRTELRHIMNTVDVSLAETDIEEMIKEADANGDGKIDFDEFIKMMQSQ